MTFRRDMSTPALEHETLDLKTMELELMERVRMVSDDKRRRRRRGKLAASFTSIEDVRIDADGLHTGKCEVESTQLVSGLPPWELVTVREPTPPHVETSRKRRLDDLEVVIVTDEELEKNRLSSEDILKLPKFKDYEPGAPNRVVYIKNLTTCTTKSDLIALFGRFEKAHEKAQYRLMSGKMRGQAFVTFSNEDVASKALSCLHGVVWKGKPMVIQYGRQQYKA